MHPKIPVAEYRSLGELRYQIPRFQHDGDSVARAAGLDRQRYQMLLAIRGLPEGDEPTIRTLAERVPPKPQSTVELIDRLEENVCRDRHGNRRNVTVSLLPSGERILDKVVRYRRASYAQMDSASFKQSAFCWSIPVSGRETAIVDKAYPGRKPEAIVRDETAVNSRGDNG